MAAHLYTLWMYYIGFNYYPNFKHLVCTHTAINIFELYLHILSLYIHGISGVFLAVDGLAKWYEI